MEFRKVSETVTNEFQDDGSISRVVVSKTEVGNDDSHVYQVSSTMENNIIIQLQMHVQQKKLVEDDGPTPYETTLPLGHISYNGAIVNCTLPVQSDLVKFFTDFKLYLAAQSDIP